MQRKIKHKRTGEVFTFLQFSTISEELGCIVEDNEGNINFFKYNFMQFVKEEPTFKSETTGTHQMKHKAESMSCL